MIKFKSTSKRRGSIETLHGQLKFPVFMPDATYGSISNVSFEELGKTGIEAIVTNTLHLEQKLGSENIKRYGGFHNFTGYKKPVLTDSGGFQVFSLIYRKQNNINKVTDAGCSFQDYETGEFKFLSPETSMHIQHSIGSDIRVVLDEPLVNDAKLSDVKRSVERTTLWAKRSKKTFLKLLNLTENDFNNPEVKRPLLTAVIQGGSNFELRKKSLEDLSDIGFDIYGLGGIPVKEARTWDYTDKTTFYEELLEMLGKLIPEDKLRYALGVGTPDNLKYAIENGWDMFDTVLPTRNARHGYFYVHKGEGDESFDQYDVLRLNNSRYENDVKPLDSKCNCLTCSSISRNYLRYLLKIKEGVGYKYASIHNLTFYANFMKQFHEKL